MKKQLLLLSMLALSFGAYAEYEYYIWFPEGASVPEIPKVHLWMFENQSKFQQLMNKIAPGQETFSEGFERGYGMVNKATVAYLPMAGKAVQEVAGDLLPVNVEGLTQTAADAHTKIGEILNFASKKIERELLQKEKKRLRIGYVSAFKPENQYYIKFEPKLRQIYIVLTIPKDVAKDLDGPAKETDMYPLIQAPLALPEGKDKGYWKVKINKNMFNGAPHYSAELIGVSEEDFLNVKDTLRLVRD